MSAATQDFTAEVTIDVAVKNGKGKVLPNVNVVVKEIVFDVIQIKDAVVSKSVTRS